MWSNLVKFVIVRISEIEDGAWQAKEREMNVVDPTRIGSTAVSSTDVETMSDPTTTPGLLPPDRVIAMCQMMRDIIRDVATAQIASETLTEAIVRPDRLTRAGEANLRAQQAIANAHRATLLSMARLWSDHPEYRESVGPDADC